MKVENAVLDGEQLDKVTGGDLNISFEPCSECAVPLVNGVCPNPKCKCSPFYDRGFTNITL